MLVRKPELRQHMVRLQSGIDMKGGPDNQLGAREQGHAKPHPRHQRTLDHRHQRLVWLHPPDERGHRRSLQPHADRRESHRVRDRERRIAKEVGLGGDVIRLVVNHKNAWLFALLLRHPEPTVISAIPYSALVSG